MKYTYKPVGPAPEGYWGHWGIMGLVEPRAKTPLAVLSLAEDRGFHPPVICEWAKPVSLPEERKFLVRDESTGMYRFIRSDEACDKPECPRDPESKWMIHDHSEDRRVVAYAATEAKVLFADGTTRKFRVTFVGEPLGRSGGYADSRTGLRVHSHFAVIEEITG